MSNKLTHRDLLRRVADATNIGQKYVAEILDAAVQVIQHELLAGRRFTLLDLGTFQLNQRGPRRMIHPYTGKEIKTKPSVIVNFRPAGPLKKKLNSLAGRL
jgi:nucleoid DNA-binding protein